MTNAVLSGIGRFRVVWRYVLLPGSGPILQVMAWLVAYALGSALVIEQAFGLSGISSVLVTAMQDRDTPVLLGGIIFVAAVAAAGFLVVDLVSLASDRRRIR